MANPNIVNVVSIFGKTSVLPVTTQASNIVINSSNSNTVVKINTLIASNINGTSAADFTASLFRSTVDYPVASTISVPADASLVVLSKDTALYLEEGDSIRCLASSSGSIVAVCSYEIIG